MSVVFAQEIKGTLVDCRYDLTLAVSSVQSVAYLKGIGWRILALCGFLMEVFFLQQKRLQFVDKSFKRV
jgi:hypothetical protein